MTLYVVECLVHGTTWTPSDVCTTNPLFAEAECKKRRLIEPLHWRVKEYIRQDTYLGFSIDAEPGKQPFKLNELERVRFWIRHFWSWTCCGLLGALAVILFLWSQS